MGIHKSRSLPHWNYFLAVERDVELLSRFLDFDPRNFDCFSLEIARILLAAGAETDVVCKQICQACEPKAKAAKINDYRKPLISIIPTCVLSQ